MVYNMTEDFLTVICKVLHADSSSLARKNIMVAQHLVKALEIGGGFGQSLKDCVFVIPT